MERLIEGASCRAEPLGEDVCRHLVERQRREHLALVRSQRLFDRIPQRAKQLGLLQVLVDGVAVVARRKLRRELADGAPVAV
jgi:hypothetical protein